MCVVTTGRRQCTVAKSNPIPPPTTSFHRYSCNNPAPGKAFLSKYFPVAAPGDECTNDLCVCPATGGVPEWYIQQGRIYFLESKTTAAAAASPSRRRLLQSPGNGFGFHLVNVSNHLTTGGLSTAAVEDQFATKLAGMSTFDSFMDFNAMLYTTDLASYIKAFKADGVATFQAVWAYNNTNWTSVFVHVPESQGVLEICSDQKQAIAALDLETVHTLETRAPGATLDAAVEKAAFYATDDDADSAAAATGTILYPLTVNRAVSAATMAKMEDFYVTGMGTVMSANTATMDLTGEAGGDVVKKCFLWPGATVDVCFTQRDPTATKGTWKVSDFEAMMHTVHENLLAGKPYCGVDKWFDNHYAIDSQSADTAKIVKYIDANKVIHYCSSQRGLHYAFDPTGWGIQLDLGFSTQPSDCSSSSSSSAAVSSFLRGMPTTGGTFNPACEPGTCT